MKLLPWLSIPASILILLLVTGCRDSPAPPAADLAAPAAAVPAAAPAVPVAAARDWCAGHGVPESVCTRCNPGLIPQFQASGDWCAGHGLPESQCTICNPELIEKFRAMAPAAQGGPAAAGSGAAPVLDWCAGHGVPETVCTRCNPGLIPQFQASGDWCAGHGLPESQCTICNPELIEKFRAMAPKVPETGRLDGPASAVPYAGVLVRLATPETAAKAGIATRTVGQGPVEVAVRAPVRLGFDETRKALVSSPVAGTVREVQVSAGQAVHPGDALATIASPTLAEARARLRESEAALVVAEAQLAREERLVARDVSPKKDLLEARRGFEAASAAVGSARGVLAALGVAATAGTGGSSQLTLRAPRTGVVTDLHIVPGQAVDPHQVLVEIHDPSRLWGEIDVAEADAPGIRPGAVAALEFESLPGRAVAATVAWVSPRLDPRTRTVHVRAEVANPDGSLRAGMFGRARVRLDSGPGLIVPGDAIQDGPEGPVAFVQVDPQVYQPRALKLGRTMAEDVEVVAGLRLGERVVTRGSFLLKTEIMKGSLGAGCCDAVEK